jgi:hypothetical protein
VPASVLPCSVITRHQLRLRVRGYGCKLTEVDTHSRTPAKYITSLAHEADCRHCTSGPEIAFVLLSLLSTSKLPTRYIHFCCAARLRTLNNVAQQEPHKIRSVQCLKARYSQHQVKLSLNTDLCLFRSDRNARKRFRNTETLFPDIFQPNHCLLRGICGYHRI